MATTKEELNASKIEGLGVAGGYCVFARAQKKENGKDDHIGSAFEGKICTITSNKLDSANYLDRDRLHSRILFLPTVDNSNNVKIYLFRTV